MATLNELNALRTAAGMKPLKVWKASKAALQTAIDKLTTANVLDPKKPISIDAGNKGILKIVDSLSEASEKIMKKVIKEKKALNGVSISEIAKSLGMNDKVARAKLRRRTDVPRLEGKAWSFAEKDVAKVKEILRQDNRKKGGAA